MESELSADRMLAEIQSESLQHLLSFVRYDTSPLGWTEIPTLDAYLSGAYPHPTPRPLNRGDVIEIQGPSSSGKTHFAYHLAITCIIPSEYQTVNLRGWGKAAVVFDSDGTFDIIRFHQLLTSRLSRLLRPELATSEEEETDNSVPEDLAFQCLLNLHICRPTSSFQLAASLLNLSDYHASCHHFQKSEIALLMIDSLSAFHWKDRFTMEQLRSGGNASVTPISGSFHHVLTALQTFRLSHNPLILLTNWGLNPISKPASGTSMPPSPFFKQHLHPFPTPFAPFSQHLPSTSEPQPSVSNTLSTDDMAPSNTNVPPASTLSTATPDAAEVNLSLPLTHHITLPAIVLPPFPSSLSLSEAREQETTYRSKIIEMGEVQGLVRTPGSSSLGKFAFWIGEKEILVSRPNTGA